RTADDRDHALTVHIFGGHSAGFGVLSGLRRLLVVVRLLVAGTPNDVRSKGAMHKTVQHAAGQDQAEMPLIKGKRRSVRLNRRHFFEELVERALCKLLLQLLVGEHVLLERVGTPRMRDLPSAKLGFSDVAW